MNNRPHIIRKIRIEVDAPADPFSMRQQAELLTAQLLPGRLEKMLSAYETKETIHLPAIRIHIRGTCWAEVEEEILRRCCEEVENHVRNFVKEKQEESAPDFTFGNNGETDKKHGAGFSELELIFHFLETGTLPWWSVYDSLPELEHEVITQLQENKARAETAWHRLRQLKSHRTSLERLVHQFSVDLPVALVASANPAHAPLLQSFLQRIGEKLDEASVTSPDKNVLLKVFLLDYFEKLLGGETDKVSRLENFMEEKKTFAQFIGRIKKQDTSLEKNFHGLSKLLSSFYEWKEKSSVTEKVPQELPVAAGEKKEPSVTGKKENVTPSREVVFYIRNAGLIILHPYLERFFDHLEWLDRDGKIRDDAKHRAVQVLQFCATSQEESPEFVLLLNKILCGVPLEFPVEKTEITEKEKAACHELLQAVIKNWPALKNSSPAALQHTFFKREGKLEWNEENWWLKVEQKTEDILLDRLPWSISRIRLRWMPHWLRVEWNS